MHPAQHERPEPPAAAASSPAFKIEPGRLTLVDPPVRHGFVQPTAGQAAELKLGTRLRLERERRRITLDSIAANTKIGLGLLQGLERNDVSRWPAGIFRRAFIRAYAEAVGLDADLIVRDFLQAFPDPADRREDRAGAVPIAGSPVEPGLRLTFADAGTAVKRPRGVPLKQRCATAASDAGAALLLGLILFVVLDQFWMALAIAMLAYYGTGIVLLGGTPGAALFAFTSSRGRNIS